MKTGKLEVFISMTLMSALTNKNDGQFPAKIKQSSWGSCTYANRLSLTKSQAIQHFFFQHLSFQSNHVIHQQELNTLKHRREHTVKNTVKLRRKMIYFYSVLLKYTTQAHSYKNQMFLRLKYMPA